MLLTDRNGLFHDLILDVLTKTQGNMLIVILLDSSVDDNKTNVSFTANELSDVVTSFYRQFLYDGELIDKLALKGSQPSVKILANNFLVCLIDFDF